jgi:hypothetical protein
VIANGGFLVNPHVVSKIKYEIGNTDDIKIESFENKTPLLKASTIDEIRSMLIYNVDNTTKISLKDGQNVNTGFYPKLMNDFNVFVNGFDLFREYSNKELDDLQKRGLKILNTYKYDYSGLTFNNWSVLVPKNIYDGLFFSEYCVDNQFSADSNYYTLPSFNSGIQTISNTTQPLTEDDLIKLAHNGSIKLLYNDEVNSFNFTDLKKPNYNEYLNTQKDTNNAYTLGMDLATTYSSIEDIFSVFDYETLNLFEKEFLEFSKSIYDINYVEDTAQISLLGLDYQDENTQYRNFQLLFRQLMEVPPDISSITGIGFIISQDNNVRRIISGLLDYDVLFKFGNPTQYNNITYNSLMKHMARQLL